MVFNPKVFTKTEGSFVFSGEIAATANASLNKDVIKEFWHGFSYHTSTLTVKECDGLVFTVGQAEALPIDEYDFSINVTPNGICVYAETEQNLLYGFMTLLDCFEATDTENGTATVIECCNIKDSPSVKNRMVHVCVFPETELWYIERFVRFCGALKYTHIVVEFWGMLKYDCMKELAWQKAYTKDEVKPIINLAHDLGLEVIPMFNHWGHAAGSRLKNGKHVVLDQNPALRTYFSQYGWCWDIRKPKVRALLKKIRRELIELCGDGEYFHVGCDEAYKFEFTKENMDFVCDFLDEIAREMKGEGRRIIVWGDMFLYRYPHYVEKNIRGDCNAPSPEVEAYFMENLNRDIVIADWHYDANVAPFDTSLVFKNAGFECLVCPWDRSRANIEAAIATACECELSGFMHTTWHTLSTGTPLVLSAAQKGFDNIKLTDGRVCAAELLRKVWFVDGDYERAGWGKEQIDLS